jgi:hypothetical protein
MAKSIVFLCLAIAASPITTFTIDCGDFVTGYFGERHGYFYACATKNTEFPSDRTVTSVTGTHQAGKTNADVKAIYIRGHRTIAFFPRGLTNFFPNLAAIDFNQAAFDTLHGDELDEFGPRLLWLFMDSSNLTTISSRLFEATPNVVYVGFSFNLMLERVGRDLFTPLDVTQLEQVGFDMSGCMNRVATNQFEIIVIIDELKMRCPFDDEFTTTPWAGSNCFEGKIESFVCDMSDKVENELEMVRAELVSKDRRIRELEATVSDQDGRLKWLEDEVLRMTTNPCACK